jgi:hypothetical protein
MIRAMDKIMKKKRYVWCFGSVLLLIGSPALAADINNGDPYYLCGEARAAAGISGKCPLPAGATVRITMHRTTPHGKRARR